MKKNIFDFHAEVCRIFSNPRRLEILNLLKNGELAVGEIIKIMSLPKTLVSQHLAVMRLRGLLTTRKEGTTVYYRIANENMAYACSLMQDVLSQILEADEERRAEREMLRKKYDVQVR